MSISLGGGAVIIERVNGGGSIPELSSDPVSPSAQQAWVLKSGGLVGGGDPIGLLLALTYPGAGSITTYQFSYRTLENTTIRATLA